MIQEFLKDKTNSLLLCKTILGIERETMRTNKDGEISRKTHPIRLGSAYTHPLIKTDFSEAQVEYATQSSYKTNSVLQALTDLHSYTQERLENETLWPFSMPPRLPENEEDIPLAVYGRTEDAIKKTIYRRGLGHRYGRRMQTISGVHINISFSKSLMSWVSEKKYNKPLSKNTQSQLYLDTIRNFNRYSFLLLYLFGASPAMDKSFTKKIPNLKELDPDTYYAPNATTIRLSELGYTSQVQNSLYISLNNLKDYVRTLCYSVSTVFHPYSQYNTDGSFEKKKQLNDYYLQLENEYYALIRPKQIPKHGERPIDSLNDRGIRYLEVRCVDADPFSPIGVTEDAVLFTELYLLYCLLLDSPNMDEEEKKIWDQNQYDVVWNGRSENTKYRVFGKSDSIQEWFEKIYPDLIKIAKIWDEKESCEKVQVSRFTEILDRQKAKIFNPKLTPSALILKHLKEQKISFLEYGLKLSKKYAEDWTLNPKNTKFEDKLDKMADESLKEKSRLEQEEKSVFFKKTSNTLYANSLVDSAKVCGGS